MTPYIRDLRFTLTSFIGLPSLSIPIPIHVAILYWTPVHPSPSPFWFWWRHPRVRLRWISKQTNPDIGIPAEIESKPSLRWRHNGCDSVSNHQPHHCLLNRLFKRRSKKTSNLRVTGLCAGKSPGTGEFSEQMASNAENVSIWWRHHVMSQNISDFLLNFRWAANSVAFWGPSQ